MVCNRNEYALPTLVRFPASAKLLFGLARELGAGGGAAAARIRIGFIGSGSTASPNAIDIDGASNDSRYRLASLSRERLA